MYEFHELRTTSIQIDSKERRLMKQRKLIQLIPIWPMIKFTRRYIENKLDQALWACFNFIQYLFEFTTYSTLFLDWI